jgi:hypothetical protein
MFIIIWNGKAKHLGVTEVIFTYCLKNAKFCPVSRIRSVIARPVPH